MLMDVYVEQRENQETLYIRNSLIFVIDLLKMRIYFFFLLYFLAGPYAKLTLLGQPKLQTQKSVPNETQTVRANHRPASFRSDRSNSLFDTKKARDQYEKILKQLDVGYIFQVKFQPNNSTFYSVRE